MNVLEETLPSDAEEEVVKTNAEPAMNVLEETLVSDDE
jgi:hypothetical protein